MAPTNNCLLKGSALEPSKNIPRERFWKNMKIDEQMIGNPMVPDDLKPLKSIQKHSLFLMLGHSHKWWKNDAKGDLKSHVFN